VQFEHRIESDREASVDGSGVAADPPADPPPNAGRRATQRHDDGEAVERSYTTLLPNLPGE
jgi:hypothetical protein